MAHSIFGQDYWVSGKYLTSRIALMERIRELEAELKPTYIVRKQLEGLNLMVGAYEAHRNGLTGPVFPVPGRRWSRGTRRR